MTNEEMMNDMKNQRRRWGRKAFIIVPLVILAIFALGYIVMALWNCIIPSLFPTLNIAALTYWHALGLLLLCKILFVGFHKGGHHGGGFRGRHRMHAAWKEKWMQMNDEEKAKFKEQWKSRCNDRC
jgi:hypothetical protein